MSICFSYSSGDDGCPVIDPLYLSRMMIDAEKILETASTHADIDGMKRWFGEKNFQQGKSSTAYTDVVLKTNSLKTYLTGGGNTVEFISKDIRSGAYANLDEPQFRIYLAIWFGMRIYSYGERLVTFFHEATHKAFGTKDIAWGGGAVGMGDSSSGKAYKGACIQLAKHQGRYKEALTNAENWGYYFVSTYFKKAGLFESAGDWNHVKSPADVESKLGPAAKDDRLTSFPDMHLAGKTWKKTKGKREGELAATEIPCVEIDKRMVYEFVVDDERVEKKILDFEGIKFG